MSSPYLTIEDVTNADCCGQPMAVGLAYINGGNLPIVTCNECGKYDMLPLWLWNEYVDYCKEVERANRRWVRELEASNG